MGSRIGVTAKAMSSAGALPTLPRSVVWSNGHAYVLEDNAGRVRWVGMDIHGRPLVLTGAQLQQLGWTPHSA